MYNRSTSTEQERLQELLRKHFEEALAGAGVEGVSVTTQHSPTMAEGFDVLLNPPVEYDSVNEWGQELIEKLQLTHREYGYYINDAKQKYDGMMIKGTAKSLLRRLNP